MIIPILWNNPWKYINKNCEHRKKKLLLNIIISHLSNEIKNNLKDQGIDFLTTNSYQKPLLFNYINLCKHLNLEEIHKLINSIHEQSKTFIIKNQLFELFINENTKFTHLYLPYQFEHQIHLIPKSETCFSDIEFFCCSAKYSRTYGYTRAHESFCKKLEDSLINHANTIQYFKTTKEPITNIISKFVNLKELELDCSYYYEWNCLENLSLPFLRILKASRVPIKILTSLIENTSGKLNEIKIDYIFHDEINNERIIQTIYNNCPNLKYLKLVLRNINILEFEKLLINCQYLEGLFILINNIEDEFNLEKLFEILTNSSPIGRHPMLLQFNKIGYIEEYTNLIEIYKSKKIVKNFDNLFYGHIYEDFEWVCKRVN
ncbi:14154_t:CDS:2 [Rhizophagus irregularis]|nr:14154_t:CDS:2 [Rhizophagus irregularis]